MKLVARARGFPGRLRSGPAPAGPTHRRCDPGPHSLAGCGRTQPLRQVRERLTARQRELLGLLAKGHSPPVRGRTHVHHIEYRQQSQNHHPGRVPHRLDLDEDSALSYHFNPGPLWTLHGAVPGCGGVKRNCRAGILPAEFSAGGVARQAPASNCAEHNTISPAAHHQRL